MSAVATHTGQAWALLEPDPCCTKDGVARWPHWRAVFPCLVAGVLLLPSLVWVLLDRSVWPWDQAWYGQESVDLFYWLKHDRKVWLQMMHAVFGIKAPGIGWFGQFFVPLGKALGSIDLGLHFSVLIYQFLTLVLVYKTGRVLWPDRGAVVPLAGSVLVGAAPLFVGISHQYLTEPLQILGVAWVFYIAAAAPGWTRLQTLAHLTAAGSVAVLAKASSPCYCLLPGLLAASTLLRRRRAVGRVGWQRTVVHLAGFLAGLALVAATAAWYHKNGGLVRENAILCSTGWVAEHYGHKEAFARKLLFWVAGMREGLFTPHTFYSALLLTLAGLAACLVGRRSAEDRPLPRWGNVLALAAVFHVLLVLSIASLSIPEDTRYIVPLLPSVAVLTMWSLARIPGKEVGMALIALSLFQWGWVHGITLGSCEHAFTSWLIRANPDPTAADEVTRIVARTSDEAANWKYNIVGGELPWFSANAFSYYSAKHRLKTNRRAYYTSLGYAENDLGRALKRLEEFKIVYFISLDSPYPADIQNLVSRPVADAVARDKHYVRLPHESKLGVVLWQRVP
jgi:hypothetical protein